MNPERILADLRQALPRDSIICTDVGWNKNGLGQQFPVYEPGTIFTPGGFATMGFGSPAALGAKLAMPDRVVVALVGDGGFGQNPAALATAFNDEHRGDLGDHEQQCLRHHRRAENWPTYGTTYGTVSSKGRRKRLARLTPPSPGPTASRGSGSSRPPSSSPRSRRRSRPSAPWSSTCT